MAISSNFSIPSSWLSHAFFCALSVAQKLEIASRIQSRFARMSRNNFFIIPHSFVRSSWMTLACVRPGIAIATTNAHKLCAQKNISLFFLFSLLEVTEMRKLFKQARELIELRDGIFKWHWQKCVVLLRDFQDLKLFFLILKPRAFQKNSRQNFFPSFFVLRLSISEVSVERKIGHEVLEAHLVHKMTHPPPTRHVSHTRKRKLFAFRLIYLESPSGA